MVPYNFEENIKQKLEERTIKPSANAWDKLSQEMDNQNKGSKSKFIWWLGVAASIVGILFVSMFFLDKSENQSSEIEIVNTPTQIETKKQENSTIEVVVANDDKTESDSQKQKLNTSQTDQIVKLKTTINKEKVKTNKELIASNTSTKEKVTNSIDLIKEKQQVQVVSVDIKQVPESNTSIDNSIDSEIDLLLKNAQQNIVTKNMVKSSSAVSANSLLEDVEMDLERSFRDKVFETVKSGYKTVKTAVAERNN